MLPPERGGHRAAPAPDPDPDPHPTLTLTLTLTLILTLTLSLTLVLTLTLSLRPGRAQRTSVTLCVSAFLYFYAAATEALGESASSSRAELVEREAASMGAEAG